MTRILHCTFAALLASSLLAGCGEDEAPTKAPVSRAPAVESTAFKHVQSTDGFPGIPPEMEKPRPPVSPTVEKAQRVLDQASAYIKDNELDRADKVLTQLDDIRDKLPTEWAIRLDQTRTNIEFLRFGNRDR
ncbi:MAG: hypothetical protein WCI73_06235 [Phycisphaerae bacterium]